MLLFILNSNGFVFRLNNELMKQRLMLVNYNLKLTNSKVFLVCICNSSYSHDFVFRRKIGRWTKQKSSIRKNDGSFISIMNSLPPNWMIDLSDPFFFCCAIYLISLFSTRIVRLEIWDANKRISQNVWFSFLYNSFLLLLRFLLDVLWTSPAISFHFFFLLFSLFALVLSTCWLTDECITFHYFASLDLSCFVWLFIALLQKGK